MFDETGPSKIDRKPKRPEISVHDKEFAQQCVDEARSKLEKMNSDELRSGSGQRSIHFSRFVGFSDDHPDQDPAVLLKEFVGRLPESEQKSYENWTVEPLYFYFSNDEIPIRVEGFGLKPPEGDMNPDLAKEIVEKAIKFQKFMKWPIPYGRYLSKSR